MWSYNIAKGGGYTTTAYLLLGNDKSLETPAGLPIGKMFAYKEKEKLWLKKAQEHGLLTSGGSDFHGDPRRFPSKLGVFKVCYEDVAAVINYK